MSAKAHEIKYIKKMSLPNLIFQLPLEQKSYIRKLERVKIKLIKAKFNLVFNDICNREKLLPKYTNLTLYPITYIHT